MGAMAENILSAAVALFRTLVGGSLTWATSWISVRAKQRDRIWDARNKSYTEIMTKLKDASLAAAAVDDGYNSGEGGRTAEDYHQSLDCRDQEAAADLAWAKCRSAFDANELTLSYRFSTRFGRLLASLPTEHEQHLPPRDAEKRARCLHEARIDLLRIAKRELGFRSD